LIEVLREIEKKTGEKISLTIKPTKRIQQDFRNGKLTGYFPALTESVPEKSLKSPPIISKYVLVFSREKVINRPDQLEGKRVGIVAGYSYGLNLTSNKKIEFVRVNTEEQGVKMLVNGRIYALLGDVASTYSEIKKQGQEKNLKYDLKDHINVLDAHIVFQGTKEGKYWHRKISEALLLMKKEGVLQKIYQTGSP